MPTHSLTHKERLLRTYAYQPVDRPPDLEFGAWQQTIDRWIGEGMDPCPNGSQGILEAYFHADSDDYGPNLGARNGLVPTFEKKVLEERGDHQIVQDAEGAIAEQLRPELGASIPHYLRFAIETHDDWVKIRDERLNPDHPDRVPRYLDAMARRLASADYPVTFSCGSLYGWIRDWMGVERVSLTLYDDRAWIEEMMETLTELTLSILRRLQGKVRIDVGTWWEDMCGRQGSLMSPRMFAEMMTPRYQRVTDYLQREFGTRHNHVDCDGNIDELVGLWLKGGVNVMFPVEVAHTNRYLMAERFGTAVAQRGSFDKRALIEGPAAIDAEFEALAPLLKRGGLVVHTDHLVPPDVSLANYTYYRRKKCQILGKPFEAPGFRRWPGHLQAWRLLGPFDNPHNSYFQAPALSAGLLDPDATVAGKGGRVLRWQPYAGTVTSGYVDLRAAVSAEPWVAAYAACQVQVPTACDAWVEIGSDDGIEVWLNGEEVYKCDAYRVAWPRQNVFPVHLLQGWNRILLRIGQAQGDWGFYLRLTDDQGRPLSGLESRP